MKAGKDSHSAKDFGSPTLGSLPLDTGAGAQAFTSKDDVYAVSGLSSSEEDEGPSSRGRQPPLRKVLKHSRLQEASPSLRQPAGSQGPTQTRSLPRKTPPARASVTWRRQQRTEARGARSWSPPAGWPGIPDTAQKRKRELKKPAAVMERVRQWEIRLLQDIEEATQHELTIEDD
ncbi:coiled-coil domain-containing protein 201 [Ursus americanus]|uniref:coiled-coil domain-containing protein 201 n=1 Tax=Ursus americanus TaxID=9643 RepID=UPI001E6796F5|nr:coiled-coil domain-containing protein 201 [Ursus americanus]